LASAFENVALDILLLYLRS